MEKNQKQTGVDQGQKDASVLVSTLDKSDAVQEEVTAPMDALNEDTTPFYSRNRVYSRYRSSRRGRNSLM